VSKLEAGELSDEPPPLEEPDELPSAEALLEDLEDYLQRLQKPDDES
jgi:hypothetical protein